MSSSNWYDQCKFPEECGNKLKKIAKEKVGIKSITATTFRHIPGEDYSGTYIEFEDDEGNTHNIIVPIDVEDKKDKHQYLLENLPEILQWLMED